MSGNSGELKREKEIKTGKTAPLLKGNLVSHYRIMCLRKNGAALINFVDARVTDGFILREGEFVTSLQALKEIGIKAGFSAFSESWGRIWSY